MKIVMFLLSVFALSLAKAEGITLEDLENSEFMKTMRSGIRTAVDAYCLMDVDFSFFEFDCGEKAQIIRWAYADGVSIGDIQYEEASKIYNLTHVRVVGPEIWVKPDQEQSNEICEKFFTGYLPWATTYTATKTTDRSDALDIVCGAKN